LWFLFTERSLGCSLSLLGSREEFFLIFHESQQERKDRLTWLKNRRFMDSCYIIGDDFQPEE
jgi:hypothetical protein